MIRRAGKCIKMKEYEHKVQYYETDQMKIVHHSNYIRWFEEARIDFLEQLGMPYEKMEADGIISPVVSASCEYKSMTHFGDIVLIEVKIGKYNGIKLEISYIVRDSHTGEIRAVGETGHCFLDETGKFVSLKRKFPEYHKKFLKGMTEV